MGKDIEQAFDDESVQDALVFLSEYRFHLKDLSTSIKVRLYKNIERGWVEFEQSHYIRTPEQAGPYITSRPWNDDEPSALRQAVSGITQYYNAAIIVGHTPSENWLIPNEFF